MEGGHHGYDLRKRKMVPKVNTDTSGRTSSTMQEGELQDSIIPSNGQTKQRYMYDQNDRTSGQPGSQPIECVPDILTLSGDEVRETSLTEPLLGSGSTDSEDDSGVEVSPQTELETGAQKYVEEASWQIGLQIFFPYLIAGFGMVGAGMVLDIVQHWSVFVEVSEVFILVPALLGLKGNLEMTLASRLSTQANLGNIDSKTEQWKMIGGNLALTQAQAIVVGFLASVAAMIFGWIPQGKFNISHGLLLCASSVVTAAVASFVLGSIMVCVVLGSRKCHINPDNVATPIAASLGDLTTLALLTAISSLLYKTLYSHVWLCPVILVTFMCLTPLWCFISHRNKYTNEVIKEGWSPVIGAMMISSVGGLILDMALTSFSGIAVFQPVINGVGGNLVAVQASRLSTALHQVSTPGNLPPASIHGCPNLCSTFFGSSMSARTARVLMYMVVPGHLVFIYTIHYMQAGHTAITLLFALLYLSAALLQVAILLFVASWLVHWLWMRGNDPDNFSIPYLTALGDLLGTGLLLISFLLLSSLGDHTDSKK